MTFKPPTDAIKDSIASAQSTAQKGATSFVDNLNAKDKALTVPQKTFTDAKRLEAPPAASGQPSGGNAHDTFFDLETWNENVLAGVQQPTYNIRFFMIEDTPLIIDKHVDYQAFIESMNKKQQTTIAATGVSDINIVSLTMESLAAPNKQTKSIATTKMTMVLKEPMGTSFMSMMAETARELRIRNFAKTYYMIEISFKGYTENGNFEVNPCAGSKFNTNKGKWLYQVAILNIDTKMDSTGGEYTVSMMPYEENMYDVNNLILPESVNTTGTTAVGILNSLATQLNQSVVYSYGFQQRAYEFKFYDLKMGDKKISINDFKVTPTKEEFGHRRSNSMSAATGNSIKAHFQQGTNINDVVELVFANSTQAQFLLLDVTTQDELAQGKKDKKEMRQSILFRCEVTADFLSVDEKEQYDYANESYIMKYTIHVLPYMTQMPILDRHDVVVSQDPKVQAKNALMLRKNGFLSKRYDYLFTGVNTEVLNLDIKFKMNWQASLPRILGTGTSTESNALPDKKPEDPKDVSNKLREELRKNQEIYRRREDKIAAADAEIDRLNKLKDDPVKPGDYDDQVKKAKEAKEKIMKDTAEIEAAKKAEEARDVILKKYEATRKTIQNAQLSQRSAKNEKRDAHLFAEDVLELASNEVRNVIAVSTVQEANDTRFISSGAIADQNTGDRSVYGAVLNQLYGGLNTQLAVIKMDVRGDPYWLGDSNLEKSFRINKRPPFSEIRIHEAEDIDLDRPAYDRGDIMFLIQFKYPRGFNAAGAPIFKSNDYFTGVYSVRRITHKFENGQFKQSIDANRLPLIDVFKAFGFRDPQEEKDKKEAKEKAAQKEKDDAAKKALENKKK